AALRHTQSLCIGLAGAGANGPRHSLVSARRAPRAAGAYPSPAAALCHAANLGDDAAPGVPSRGSLGDGWPPGRADRADWLGAGRRNCGGRYAPPGGADLFTQPCGSLPGADAAAAAWADVA